VKRERLKIAEITVFFAFHYSRLTFHVSPLTFYGTITFNF
jgi:hypothetical protein